MKSGGLRNLSCRGRTNLYPATACKSIDELRRLYGEPYYTDKNGIPCLNESFWAGLFATENIVLWEPSERAFYSYRAETGIYEEESADAIKRRISDRLLEASRQMNCFELEKQRSDSRLNSIVAHLRGIVERRGAFVQRAAAESIWQMACFLSRTAGNCCRFSPAFVSRNRCPIAFDENAKCERFLNELVYPAVHPDDVVLIQKYAGLCLLGNNLIQRMLILDGESARGKTQLANVIQAVVGRENVTQLRTKWLAERFETYRFLKKTLADRRGC